MEKKNIAVLAGGYSSEFVISLRSAQEIAKNLAHSLYNVHIIKITKDAWEVESEIACGIPINKNDFSFSLNNQKTKFDVVFMAIHGTPGEDGRLQAYFEMLGIPVTTANTTAMALSFDKFFCNQYLKSQNILVSDSIKIRNIKQYSEKEIIERMGLPLFVKPTNAGSSFGVSKVNKPDEMHQALEKAFAEGGEIMVEKFVKGRELTAGVFISQHQEILLPVTEIISKKEFFDYEAKYTPSLSEEITPANIPAEVAKQVQQTARNIYKLLEMNGVARVDFIWTGTELFFLEINTVPGMTLESLVPQQVKVAGYSLQQFYTWLIEDALQRNK